MKILCVSCDAQMSSLEARRQQDDGTMSIVFECPDCARQFAMLVNPMETKVVDSLDVSLCPVGGKGRDRSEARPDPVTAATGPAEPAAVEAATTAITAAGETGGSKCPFADRVARDDERLAQGAHDLAWSQAAESRLENIPSFVRPMARRGIEMFAREQGYPEVTEAVLEEARHAIGM